MSEARKMADRWWIEVCPECNGLVGERSQAHNETCPNRYHRAFAVEAVEVVPAPRPGEHAALAAGLDEYHAVNLLDALTLVPDTGDWHGSLRIACEMAIGERGTGMAPNRNPDK